MPYANDYPGVYRIVDTVSQTCYVGQSRSVRKRIGEHFRLLRKGEHPNPHLQFAFDCVGESRVTSHIEITCEDPADLADLEEAFLQGEARFDDSPKLFNISSTAHRPMHGRKHTDLTKAQISATKTGRKNHVTEEYRGKLSKAQRARALSDPEHLAKVMFIVENPHLSYAERGRRVGLDTSRARRLALKYGYLKGQSHGQH